MSEIKIRDLYTGKPDAKDEINFEGLEEFIKTFVVADHFQLAWMSSAQFKTQGYLNWMNV